MLFFHYECVSVLLYCSKLPRFAREGAHPLPHPPPSCAPPFPKFLDPSLYTDHHHLHLRSYAIRKPMFWGPYKARTELVAKWLRSCVLPWILEVTAYLEKKRERERERERERNREREKQRESTYQDSRTFLPVI